MAACCIENCNVIAVTVVPLKLRGLFWGFFWLDKQRNVLYAEFESTEKYARLLQNTSLFPIDNSTRHVDYGHISLNVHLAYLHSFFFHLNESTKS